LGMVAQW